MEHGLLIDENIFQIIYEWLVSLYYHSHKREIVWKHGPFFYFSIVFSFYVDMIGVVRIRVHQIIFSVNKMAALHEDLFFGDDLHAVLAAVVDNLLEEDAGFILQLDNVTEEVGESQSSTVFKCNLCPKIYKSKRGFTQHVNTKHKPGASGDQHNPGASGDQSEAKSSSSNQKCRESILHPSCFKIFLEKSVEKLSNDGCYPEVILAEFRNYKVASLDNVNHSYAFIKDVIQNYNGDAEKFYPLFYKNISRKNVFLNLSKNCSTLLGFEVANLVLAHLSGTNFKDDVFDSNIHATQLSPKEKSIICYFGGYVFGTLCRRLRFSKTNKNIFNQQSLSILLAGKASDNQQQDEYKLIDSKNRGGLWKITNPVIEMFITVGLNFRLTTDKCTMNIDSKALTSLLLKDCGVLSNFNKVRNNSDEKICKEVALNCLEHIIIVVYPC